MAVLAELRVADDAEAWRAAGFAVGDGGRLRIGRTTIRLTGRAGDHDGGDGGDGDAEGTGGVVGWTLLGLAAAPPGGTLDGLPTEDAEDADAAEGAGGGEGDTGDPVDLPASHPNGCTRVDHVVALTPDLDRTTAALAAAGIEARRTREAGRERDGTTRLQRFFRLGEVILELVGPAEPTGDGPARFWGLAHVVADLDATADLLGDRLSAPRDAVQPGRRIASLRRHAGVAVPTAFLTEEPRRLPR